MNFTKKNIVLYSIITIAILTILLFCDALFAHSAVTGDISRAVYAFFNTNLGSISFVFLVTMILLAVVFIFPTDKIPRYNWLAGISCLLVVMPALLEFVKISGVSGGRYGLALNTMIVKTGNFAYLIYGVSVFLGYFIFLFPYRYLLSGWAVGLISHKGEVKSEQKTKTENNFQKVSDFEQDLDFDLPDNEQNFNYYKAFRPNYHNDLNNAATESDLDDTVVMETGKTASKPPFVMKVVYDEQSRVEYPCFNKNEKPKKFIYDSEDKDFVYFRQDNSATETDAKPKKSTKSHAVIASERDYYQKSKEYFPEWWNANRQDQTHTVDNVTTPEKHSTLETVNNVTALEKHSTLDSQADEVANADTVVENKTSTEIEEIHPEAVVTSLDFEQDNFGRMKTSFSIVNDEQFQFDDDKQDKFGVNEKLQTSQISQIINHITQNNDKIETVEPLSQEFDADSLIDDDSNPTFEDTVGDDSWNSLTAMNSNFDDEGFDNSVDWQDALPDTDLLQSVVNEDRKIFEAEEKQSAEILEATLFEFKIKATVSDIIHGPTVTLFKVVPAAGVKLTSIEGLSNNLAMRLSAKSIRIIAPIPGESVVGIEIPNRKRETVSFKEIVDSQDFVNTKMNIPIGIGKDIYGNIIMLDMYKMPHILIAGATGAGKSVCVNSFICSILCSRSPDEVRMVLIDPKVVELKPYNDIPHLITPVITDPKKAINALKYLVFEMERRYSLLGDMGVRDIVEYRKALKTKRANMENLPFIVAFVDEFADLMSTSGKETEMLFARLTAKARAVGILLVLATQRPSTDVITGLIKANVPARISFQVISLQDSRIILDQKGAEKLLGQGDMLYLSPTQPFPTRVQGAFLSKEEVDALADHWKSISEPNYINIEEMIADFENEEDGGENIPVHDSGSRDALFEQAIEIARQSGTVSASYLQRRLSIGYNRAANIVETMEDLGMVGPANGSKPREFLG